MIEAVKSKPTGEHTYTILFEDDYIAEVDEGEIVGPGFNPVGVRAVKDGQRVFISFKGREVEARVVKTRLEFNEVLVQILDRPDTVVAVTFLTWPYKSRNPMSSLIFYFFFFKTNYWVAYDSWNS